MTTFPGSPRLLMGGIVLIDPDSASVQRIIALQYNPKTLTRSLEVQSIESAGGDRSEALRLTGPAVETITLGDVEIDATDQLEFPDQNLDAVEFGIQPQLAASAFDVRAGPRADTVGIQAGQSICQGLKR